MIKHNKLVLFFFAASLLVLAGCGQKAPLYLPEQEKVQTNQAEEVGTEQVGSEQVGSEQVGSEQTEEEKK
jgi:predicted small lipoprotein YifL